MLRERRTFTRYAVRRTTVHEQPSEQRVAGNVLLRPRHAEPLAPAAVLPTHFRLVEHLTAAVLPLLIPAVPSWREKSHGEVTALHMMISGIYPILENMHSSE